MRSLRRLSAVSIASFSAILFLSSFSASAQSSPAIPFTPATSAQPSRAADASPWTIHVSPTLTVPSIAEQQFQPSTTFRLPPVSAESTQNLWKTFSAEKLALLAGNEGPCYALRTYGFTTPRDTASAPQMSSYKTCTPAAQAHLKELVKAPQKDK